MSKQNEKLTPERIKEIIIERDNNIKEFSDSNFGRGTSQETYIPPVDDKLPPPPPLADGD